MKSFLLHQPKWRKYAANRWSENVELFPKIKEMVSFELDLWDLVNKLKFRKISSNFQNQLKEDIKAIKKPQKLFVFADTTSHIYQIETDEYSKLTTNAITSTYKKISDKISNKIIKDGKKIIENKEVVNQMVPTVALSL